MVKTKKSYLSLAVAEPVIIIDTPRRTNSGNIAQRITVYYENSRRVTLDCLLVFNDDKVERLLLIKSGSAKIFLPVSPKVLKIIEKSFTETLPAYIGRGDEYE